MDMNPEFEDSIDLEELARLIGVFETTVALKVEKVEVYSKEMLELLLLIRELLSEIVVLREELYGTLN